jgi:tRNA-Thr(GGU) m(6)t(6)A37 methyltransferase TsaA
MTTISMTPIGRVMSARDEAVDDAWDSVATTIVLDPAQLKADAAAGLEGFSHIVVTYVFDRVGEGEIERGARHPRGRTDWPRVGILAQRAKNRPNRIGITTCRLLSANGLTLKVQGLDAIDGTPILDIKPHMSGFDARGPVREPAWSRELMERYWE